MITPPEFREVTLATQEIHWHQELPDPPAEEAQRNQVALYVCGQINLGLESLL